MGALQVSTSLRFSGAGTRALAELSPTQYPYLAETARTAHSVDAESEFRLGMALLLRGLAAELE
jgi:hypothetical protein